MEVIEKEIMSRLNIIPAPASLKRGEGNFDVPAKIGIAAVGADAGELRDLLFGYLRETGIEVEAADETAGQIVLRTRGEAVYDAEGFADEAYLLRIAPGRIDLDAANRHGLLMGVQVLRQIFLDAPSTVPAGVIEDAPRFRWRGAHLDVSRHFFSKADVCRFIDLLALHRCNRLHLHLTDDQGWRIPVPAFPKLAESASQRDETLIGHHNRRPHRFDGRPYGGCYTRSELEEMVTFAHARGMEIVPEIDMPGHMQAAISAYPELGCTGFPVRPRTIWGISQDILNVEESTVEFMQTVLDEVIDIFPGRYIHVGGDEAHKYQWENSKRVQERMAELGLDSENALQSWFIRRMNAHIASRGRLTIGWDEIMEGGLPDGTAVMSWRGEGPGKEAVRLGHAVVMTPTTWTYFDYFQRENEAETRLGIGGYLPLEKVYAYDPVPADLEGDAGLILGTQGQLWTEYIPTRDDLDYMAFPRICALAEAAWTPAARREFDAFRERLDVHQRRLAKLGVAYCGR